MKRPLIQLAGTLCLLVTGCLSPKVQEAATPLALPETFSETGTASVPDEWWTSFGDTAMNDLESRALAENPGLMAAWERLRQAEALVSQKQSATRPTLNADGSASRTRSETRQMTTYANSFALGLAASYELDLWGKLAARTQAQQLAAQASAADLRTAALTLSGEVANAWLTTRELRQRLSLLDQLKETNATQLSVLEQRYDLGRAEGAAVVQQRQLVANTEATIATTRGELKEAEIRLNVLLGSLPQAPLIPESKGLPGLPPLPATGVPGTVLMRRPDVEAAWLRLSSADHSYAAAVTDRLPALTLSASASTSAPKTDDLFRNWASSIAAGLTAPILDGGRRKAVANQAKSTADEAYWQLIKQMLAASQEIETAIAAENQQTAYLTRLEEQLRYARQSADLLKARYYQGSDTFTSYLQAVKTSQELELNQLQAQGNLLRNRVALYRALAGGFPTTEPAPLPNRVDHFLLSSKVQPATKETTP